MVRTTDVRALRKRMGWSTYDLAEKIGCHQSTVSRIENGARISRPITKLLEQLIEESMARDAA